MLTTLLASILWKPSVLRTVPLTRTFANTSVCSGSMTTVVKHTSLPKTAEKVPEGMGCPLCRAGLHKFGYRDVLLLRQFLTPDGLLIGRRYTGICPKMQRRITKAIRRSRKHGLLPNFKSTTKSSSDTTK